MPRTLGKTGTMMVLTAMDNTVYTVSITAHQELVVSWPNPEKGRDNVIEHCELQKFAPGERFSFTGHDRYASEPYLVAKGVCIVTEPIKEVLL